MASYRFLTTWLLDSPVGPVFDAIHDTNRWPRWWKGVTRVTELEAGGEDGTGRAFAIAWRSFLPYDLEFQTTVTRVDRPHLMEGEARGELEGQGRWRLFEHGGVTAVLYEWNVATTKAWMNRVAPVARPVFAWNHNWVMRSGGRGLARLLGVRLIAHS